jgi:hypothetical protein
MNRFATNILSIAANLSLTFKRSRSLSTHTRAPIKQQKKTDVDRRHAGGQGQGRVQVLLSNLLPALSRNQQDVVLQQLHVSIVHVQVMCPSSVRLVSPSDGYQRLSFLFSVVVCVCELDVPVCNVAAVVRSLAFTVGRHSQTLIIHHPNKTSTQIKSTNRCDDCALNHIKSKLDMEVMLPELPVDKLPISCPHCNVDGVSFAPVTILDNVRVYQVGSFKLLLSSMTCLALHLPPNTHSSFCSLLFTLPYLTLPGVAEHESASGEGSSFQRRLRRQPLRRRRRAGIAHGADAGRGQAVVHRRQRRRNDVVTTPARLRRSATYAPARKRGPQREASVGTKGEREPADATTRLVVVVVVVIICL